MGTSNLETVPRKAATKQIRRERQRKGGKKYQAKEPTKER